MIWIVIGFLALSLFLYCLLGGADFGAGILKIFTKRKDHEKYDEIVAKAMGPVWEANHIWLIILIVILFNGFPTAYSTVSIYFHVPLMIMLLGIIIRGCAFTFRHYDAIRDNARYYYDVFFSFSSFLTPLMLGMIVGGLMLGRVDPQGQGYYAVYMAPWFNWFCFSVGIFTVSIFAFLASVFLIGETQDQTWQLHFMEKAKVANLIAIILGGVVFLTAQLEGYPLLEHYLTRPLSLTGVLLATVSLFPLWLALKRRAVWHSRFWAGFQLAMILAAWFMTIFPEILSMKNSQSLTFFNTSAPQVSLNILGWALIIGVFFFIPALSYLLWVFKANPRQGF
ncbi:MAG: cytochrome d ubiquinol oxidase subunit II [Candidatus Omnitrophica bacterium]|nr:cytochrome d ubiquinol oxidase subunit II [Candidatus Omnitrophota bacterium]